MSLADSLLRAHGLRGPATLLPLQGRATVAYATRDVVIKIAHPPHRDQMLTEALVAPLARAAGVRTPALIAWAREPELAYSIWERVDGAPLDDDSDAPDENDAWRAIGRELALLHAIAAADDPRGLLRKPDKRDARPYLHLLPDDAAARLRAWLARCAAVPAEPPRLLHYDVHGLNVLRAADGSVHLVDWADAAWGDPAADFGSLPVRHVGHVLDGYRERASLGPGAEARVLRALIGQAARKATTGWSEPLDALLAWLPSAAAARFRDSL